MCVCMMERYGGDSTRWDMFAAAQACDRQPITVHQPQPPSSSQAPSRHATDPFMLLSTFQTAAINQRVESCPTKND